MTDSSAAALPVIVEVSRQRVQPLNPPTTTTTTQLSLLDNSVLRFAIASATWIYTSSPPVNHLVAALSRALDDFPHLAGQLQRSPSALAQTSGNASGLEVVCGPSSPGVEVIHATSEGRICDVLPPYEERLAKGVWDATELNKVGWHEQAGLALGDGLTSQGRPSCIVKLIDWSCRSTSISFTLAHPLADADSLTQIVTHWANVSQAMLNKTPIPACEAIFDPAAINTIAGDALDPELIALAESAPIHRYDWQAPNPEADMENGWIAGSSTPLPPFEHIETKWRGTPLPWSSWDLSVPGKRLSVFFTRQEIEAMAEEAHKAAEGAATSKLDALLAFLWQATMRARIAAGVAVDPTKGEEEVYLDMSMGARTRIPLPPTSLGSPIFIAPVTWPSPRSLVDALLGRVACAVREEIQRYQPELLKALLHEWKFVIDSDATRRWDTFLGRKTLLTTSWLNLPAWEPDFGTGTPSDTFANMPNCDSAACLQMAKPVVSSVEGVGGRRKWWSDGAVIDIFLRFDVAAALLEGAELRRFRK